MASNCCPCVSMLLTRWHGNCGCDPLEPIWAGYFRPDPDGTARLCAGLLRAKTSCTDPCVHPAYGCRWRRARPATAAVRSDAQAPGASLSWRASVPDWHVRHDWLAEGAFFSTSSKLYSFVLARSAPAAQAGCTGSDWADRAGDDFKSPGPFPIGLCGLQRLSNGRQVLRDVGLKSEMDRDAFKGCAQRIAAAGTSQLADPGTPAAERHRLLDTAGALARYFVANVSGLHSNNFYEGIGALSWVPATKVQPMGCDEHCLGLRVTAVNITALDSLFVDCRLLLWIVTGIVLPPALPCEV